MKFLSYLLAKLVKKYHIENLSDLIDTRFLEIWCIRNIGTLHIHEISKDNPTFDIGLTEKSYFCGIIKIAMTKEELLERLKSKGGGENCDENNGENDDKNYSRYYS